MQTQRQKGINKTAPKLWLSQSEIQAVSQAIQGTQARLIFQIMVATGQKFSRIKETQWLAFNKRLNTLDFNNHNTCLPDTTALELSILRQTAKAEDCPIFSISYRQAWQQVSRAYFKVGIEQTAGPLKLAKYSFARRHYETYQNKKKLADDMGLTTARWIPKQVFNYTGPTACLVQF